MKPVRFKKWVHAALPVPTVKIGKNDAVGPLAALLGERLIGRANGEFSIPLSGRIGLLLLDSGKSPLNFRSRHVGASLIGFEPFVFRVA